MTMSARGRNVMIYISLVLSMHYLFILGCDLLYIINIYRILDIYLIKHLILRASYSLFAITYY